MFFLLGEGITNEKDRKGKKQIKQSHLLRRQRGSNTKHKQTFRQFNRRKNENAEK